MTALIAGPGFGKSLALSQYAVDYGEMLYWASPKDAEPQRLISALLHAHGRPSAEGGVLLTLERHGVVAAARHCAEALERATTIIDDAHRLAGSSESMRFLVALIESAPDRARFLISTRFANALPFERWTSDGIADEPLGGEELAFTLGEIDALLGPSQERLVEARCVLDATSGWPIAVARIASAKTRPGAEAAVTDKSLARFAEREIIGELDTDELLMLQAAAILPQIRLSTVRLITFPDALARARQLAVRLGPLVIFDRETLEVREPLRAAIAALEDKSIAEFVGDACVLERDFRSAITAYVRGDKKDLIVALLDLHGRSLIEDKDEHVLAGLDASMGRALRHHPAVLALTAMRELRSGDLDRAETLYRAGMTACTDLAMRAAIAHSLASLLTARGKPGGVELLEPLRAGELPRRTQCEVLGTLAASYVLAVRPLAAREAALEAVDVAEGTVDDQLLAGTLQRAAYVAFHAADGALARELATRAVTIARAIGDEVIISRASMMLYSVAYAYFDNRSEALECARDVVRAARSAGDVRYVTLGLTAAYEICVETGDSATADQIDRELVTFAPALGYQDTPALHVARALRCATYGDFQGALQRLGELRDERCTQAERLLREAFRVALLPATGQDDAAAEIDHVVSELRQAESAPVSLTDARSLCFARLLLALALGLEGRNAEGLRTLSKKRPALNGRTADALSSDIATVLRMRLPKAIHESEADAYESLRAMGLEGWHQAIEALVSAVRRAGGDADCPLTPAQLTVLRELARGTNTRDASAALDISPNTHANHIRSIIRKLGCSGRREALQIARARGYV